MRVHDGTGWVTASAGDFLHVPHGGLHGFRGRDRARMLLMFTPGAPPRGLLRDPRRRGARAADDRDERVAFMLQHDTYWV